VIIEGLGCDHTSFMCDRPAAFAGHYRLLMFDNRGVGMTDKPDEPYSIEMMADDVAGLMDAVGIERAHIAGWSMGGLIAQQFAIRHPDKTRSLQLHCTYARPDRYLKWWMDVRRMLATELGFDAVWRHGIHTAFTPDYFEAHIDELEAANRELANPTFDRPMYAYLHQLEACRNHNAEPGLPHVTVPTLITVGAEDVLTAPRFAYRMKKLMPHAELVVVENAAHSHFAEQFEKHNAICLDFLARCSASATPAVA
jgi:pimeloyl-ACP methyl ester carboxylesterase